MGKADTHLHLGLVTSKHRMRGLAGGQRNYFLGIIPQPAIMKSSSPVDMLPHLKELGISGGIILSTGKADAPFYQNDTTCQAAEAVLGMFAWMCNLDERDIDTAEERLRNYKQAGAVGIGEFTVNGWIGTPSIEAAFTAAEKLHLPTLFHMSPGESFNYGIADKPGFPLLEEAPRRHSGLVLVDHNQPFWYEIFGDASTSKVVRSTWDEDPITPDGRLMELLECYPSLYSDLPINSDDSAVMRDEPLGLPSLEKFQDRLIFGADMRNMETTFLLGARLDEKLAEGELSREVYKKICVKNVERVSGL